MSKQYHTVPVDLGRLSYLAPLRGMLDDSAFLYLPSDSVDTRRTRLDGLWLVFGSRAGRDVALAWSDFRVKGGSIGDAAADRLSSFLDTAYARKLPVVLVVDSLGLRFTEGRAIFGSVFELIPRLRKLKQEQLLITICRQRCFGIAALLFGMGHYRLAAGGQCTISLTGPEVFRLFFGPQDRFDEAASVTEQFKSTGLVHEIGADLPDALERAGRLLEALSTPSGLLPLHPEPGCADSTRLTRQQQQVEAAVLELLTALGDRRLELFPGFDAKLRVFIIDVDGERAGLLMNPCGQTDNLFGFRTLLLYRQALSLFRFLELPILVLLDTPGIDPRFDHHNERVVEMALTVTEDIIAYPFRKMGIGVGRSFGGGSAFGIPKVFGACAQYALKNRAQLGVMHESIMRHLLAGSKGMLADFESIRATETADCSDMIEAGILDGLIELSELRQTVRRQLFPDPDD